MISKNNLMKEKEEPSGLQAGTISFQARKVQNKRNYKLSLNEKTLNFQLAKRVESTNQSFSQYEMTENDDSFRAFANTLKLQSNARELDVFGDISVEIGNQNLFFISKTLKNFVSLQTLKLDFLNCWGITDEGLEVLSQGFKGIFGVKTLVFCLRNCSNAISDFGVQKISQSLRSLISLEDLTLKFGDSDKITSTSLRFLGKSLKRLKSLASLSLKFRNWKSLDEDGLNYLSRGLKKLNCLERLDIDFRGCRQLSQPGVLDLCKNLESLKSLKSLGLRLSFCDVSDDVLLCLSNSLQGIIAGLHNMIFDFSYCLNVKNAGFDYFFHGFKNLIDLESISLAFSHCRVSSIGLVSLSSALQNMPNLKNLNLELSKCDSLKTKELNQGLSTLKALQSINLNFESNFSQTQDGASGVYRVLSLLPLLLSMKISFKGCSQIDDQGLEEMSQYLKDFTGLKILDLNFSQCDQISDSGLEFLAKSLRNIVLLQELRLDFRGCNQITDESLKNMNDNLKKLSYLKDLHLEFSDCPQITETGLRVLARGLKKYPALKDALIYLFGCKNITENMLESVRKEINSPSFVILGGHVSFDLNW